MHKETISHAQYVKTLRRRLPPEAFAAAPRKLWIVAAHLVIIIAAFLGLRYSTGFAIHLLLSVCIGHSLACIAFQAHHLSHNSIVRSDALRYPLEVLLWGVNNVPATLWQRLHNQTHHMHANTMRDPDRYFTKSELELPGFGLRRWFAKLFWPSRTMPAWNPLIMFHFVTYIAGHLLAVFYPVGSMPSIVTDKPTYSQTQRFRILIEIFCIALLQYATFIIVGSQWEAFIWASPVATLVESAVVMSYVWTQHNLHPVSDVHDPVANTSSVIVHPLWDRLYSNISYHTAHHVFPTMNTDYYPLVEKLLSEAFPDQYHRIPFKEAWRQLFQLEQYGALQNEQYVAQHAETSQTTPAEALM